MTICFAAICQNSQAVLVASDKMIPWGMLAAEFEHPDGKIRELASRCVGMTAGDALAGTGLFANLRDRIDALQNPTIKTVADESKAVFVDMRLRRAEDFFPRSRGLPMSQNYQ